MRTHTLIRTGIYFLCAFLSISSNLQADESGAGANKNPSQALESAEKKVTNMGKALKKLLSEQRKAREKKDVRLYNCLTEKVDAVSGLLTAAERAKGILRRAAYSSNPSVSQVYATKIDEFEKTADEELKSVPDCYGIDTQRQGAATVYIHPEGAPESEFSDLSPWDRDWDAGAGEDYPAVPPASPFR